MLKDREDQRMQPVIQLARKSGVSVQFCNRKTLDDKVNGAQHQGVVAKARLHDAGDESDLARIVEREAAPFLLILDGITDPHNLGACLRVADGAGVHAVVAPKDHAVGVNATVAKVASGAADTIPYFMVTNLSRTIKELQECGIWVIGTSDTAEHSIYDVDLTGPVALVLGAEGTGMRQLTAKNCDQLVSIPMLGGVESLYVSVASGVCLYEAVRQRQALAKTTNKVV